MNPDHCSGSPEGIHKIFFETNIGIVPKTGGPRTTLLPSSGTSTPPSYLHTAPICPYCLPPPPPQLPQPDLRGERNIPLPEIISRSWEIHPHYPKYKVSRDGNVYDTAKKCFLKKYPFGTTQTIVLLEEENGEEVAVSVDSLLGKLYEIRTRKKTTARKGRRIFQYDKEGKLIREFETTKQASEILKVRGRAIRDACRNSTLCCGTFLKKQS